MFRIDRMNVNLASAWSIQVVDETPKPKAGAEQPEAKDASLTAASIMRDILSKAEERAEEKAERIIGEAREKAASILIDAREQALEDRRNSHQEGYAEGRSAGYTEGRSEGYTEGNAEGYAAGFEEGRQAFDDKIQEDDEKLKSAMGEIYHEWEQACNELEDGAADLSLAIVRKIFGTAAEELDDVFESLIRNALRQMSTDRKIIIRVGADEYKRFFSSGFAVFELDGGVTVTASVIEDLSLGEGDCIIDAGDETVNAGLESQLKYVKLAFDRAE
ncbi:MAG: hypothetical protein LBH28_01375 [Oscillospiraceae bacterium]|nr:hypothetical protein [Oscillospiraceae bacterium]